MTDTLEPQKSSWPLLLLSATGVIPDVGFLTSVIALSWGLLSDRPHARLATIIAATCAMGQLASLAALQFADRHDPDVLDRQRTFALHDLYRIDRALADFRREHGAYPVDLRTLVGYPIPHLLLSLQDQGTGELSLKEYVYHLAPDGRSYELLSRGPDGLEGTADDLHPPAVDPFVRRPAGGADTLHRPGHAGAPGP